MNSLAGRQVPESFYRVCTLDGGLEYYPLYGVRGEALWQKMILGHSKGLK